MAHGHANPASVKNAMYDVITAHFNGEYDSETAVEELVSAVEIAHVARLRGGRQRRPPRPRAETPPMSQTAQRAAPAATTGCATRCRSWCSARASRSWLIFVYGFILFTFYLSFTDSRILPSFGWVGWQNYDAAVLAARLGHRGRQPR